MPNKIVVILGQTASGKSGLAVKIAKKFKGEVISADSRQVYEGMDIGTGKITKKEMGGITHYLLDVASPKRIFTVSQYRKLALKAIDKIFKKGKVPIICGGTAFYIRAVIDGLVIPQVAPDWKLRKKLEKKSPKELFKLLKKLDPRRAKTIEKENPRRLIRAIEIVLKTKKPVPELKTNPIPYPVLMIGIKKNPEELKKLIKKRLLKRLKNGMITEVERLKQSGLSWKRLNSFGLEYRWLAKFLQNLNDGYRISIKSDRISDIHHLSFDKTNFFNLLQKDIEHFAKRQITWWKKDKRIHWIESYKQAEGLVKNFLQK